MLSERDRRTEARPNADGGAADGERRQVTGLFCDLTGYTELTRQLGAERTHELAGLRTGGERLGKRMALRAIGAALETSARAVSGPRAQRHDAS